MVCRANDLSAGSAFVLVDQIVRMSYFKLHVYNIKRYISFVGDVHARGPT